MWGTYWIYGGRGKHSIIFEENMVNSKEKVVIYIKIELCVDGRHEKTMFNTENCVFFEFVVSIFKGLTMFFERSGGLWENCFKKK